MLELLSSKFIDCFASMEKGDFVVSDIEFIKYITISCAYYLSPFSFIILALLGFIAHYLRNVVHTPALFCTNKNGFEDKLKRHLKDLDEWVWPPFWCYWGLAQSVLANMLPGPNLESIREFIFPGDGGSFSLDWFVTKEHYHDAEDKSPVVLIFPGHTGHGEKPYVRKLIAALNDLNLRAVVFNNRGLGSNVKLHTPYMSCVARTGDMEHAIKYIDELHPGAPVLVVAVSITACMFLNYASRIGKDILPNIVGAFLISTPWNALHAKDQLSKGLNNLIVNRHMTGEIRDIIVNNKEVFDKNPQLPYNMDGIMKAKTLWDLDDAYICPMYGFKDHFEFYKYVSVDSLPLEDICIPILALSAEDDCFCQVKMIPLDRIYKNLHFGLVITRHGGHIGFLEGFLTGSNSMTIPHKLLKDYASMLLLEQNGK